MTSGHRYILEASNSIFRRIDKATFQYDYKTPTTFITLSGTTKLPIFAFNDRGTMRATSNGVKLYGLQIYDGSTLIADYMPAQDVAGVNCLYDKVTKTILYEQSV